MQETSTFNLQNRQNVTFFYKNTNYDKERHNSLIYDQDYAFFLAKNVLSLIYQEKKIFFYTKKEIEMKNEKKIGVYIADSDNEELEKIVKYFKSQQEFEVVGSGNSGDEVAKEVCKLKPEVLVSEVLLSGVDGFKVLEMVKTQLGEEAPKVIFVSNLTHAGFISKAMKEGASYFMVKPISYDNLKERIFEFTNSEVAGDADKALDEKIANIFISIGIPAHIKGYHFLREAVKLAVVEPDIISSITKKLYPTIAEKFATSSSKVERGMRHAIEVAWNRGKIENINNLFGLQIYSSNEKPTNGELIALIADKMLMEG